MAGTRMKIIMMTGDHAITANAIARQLGIDEVYASVLPEGKLDLIQALQLSGRRVAMVGDGINDAPALAKAHVGLAMGAGTDVAIQTAGITLLRNDLSGVINSFKLSQYTMQNIRQNLFFAFAYNFLGVPIAAGLLYPFWGITLNPMMASAAMSLSSVSVILNALRLRNR